MQSERKAGTLFVRGDYQPLSRYIVVYLNGIDVTNRCSWASDDGLVCLYKHDEHGKFYIEGNQPAKETLEGKVEIGLKPEAPDWVHAALDELRWSPAVPYFPEKCAS